MDFIKAVGFDHDDDGNITNPTMVSFKYQKPVEVQGEGGAITIVPRNNFV